MLALPAEGAGRRPGLDHQVVTLLEAFPIFHRIVVGGDGLHPGAADETRDQPSARYDVDHRQLFRQPDRVVVDGQDIAQQQDLGLVGDASQYCRRQVGGGVHARRRVVVLIEHDAVEAQLVGVHALVEIALEEAVGRVGVEPRVGEGEAQRRVLVALFVGVLVVGELGEVVALHGTVASGGVADNLPIIPAVQLASRTLLNGEQARAALPEPYPSLPPGIGAPAACSW